MFWKIFRGDGREYKKEQDLIFFFPHSQFITTFIWDKQRKQRGSPYQVSSLTVQKNWKNVHFTCCVIWCCEELRVAVVWWRLFNIYSPNTHQNFHPPPAMRRIKCLVKVLNYEMEHLQESRVYTKCSAVCPLIGWKNGWKT